MKQAVLFLCLLFPVLSVMAADMQRYPVENTLADYCYKPEKPLWLSTRIHQKEYEEDMQEYERCKKHFYQVQKNIAKMKLESEQRSQEIQQEFEQRNK